MNKKQERKYNTRMEILNFSPHLTKDVYDTKIFMFARFVYSWVNSFAMLYHLQKSILCYSILSPPKIILGENFTLRILGKNFQ